MGGETSGHMTRTITTWSRTLPVTKTAPVSFSFFFSTDKSHQSSWISKQKHWWDGCSDRLWKLYLVLGLLMGLQGTEEGNVDWPVAGGSLTTTNTHKGRHYCQSSNFNLKICFFKSKVMVVTMWLLCFCVTRGDFEWVTSSLTPARRVDVWVIWVHPFVIDVTPTIIMDLEGNQRYNLSSEMKHRWPVHAFTPLTQRLLGSTH